MFRKIALVAIVALAGGTALAGPFFQRGNCRGVTCLAPATASPTATGPLQEFKQEVPHVPQPWLLISEADDTSSQQPDTALEPISGTGSKLPIGLKVPDKITHVLDGDLMKKLDAVAAALSRKPEPVTIAPLMEDATSQRLSRILMVLEWFLYVGGGLFAGSKVGPFLQLVARVVSGLPSALKEPSPMPPQIPVATSSTQVSGS